MCISISHRFSFSPEPGLVRPARFRTCSVLAEMLNLNAGLHTAYADLCPLEAPESSGL